MSGRRPWTTVAAIIFLIIALVHLYRLVVPFDIVIGGTQVSQTVSIVGLLVAGLFSIVLWREGTRR